MTTTQQLLIICPLVFFAGFVDSMAGGGGIISLPAYVAVGLSPHMALGTNKFSSTWGTALSTFRFFRKGKIHIPAGMVSIVAALIGSACGAKLALSMDRKVLQYFLMGALPVLAGFILMKKDFVAVESRNHLSLPKTLLLSFVFAFFIGGYDGFFGPGTGTFLIIVFNTVIGFELLTASGNAKVVNLSSNAAALVTFLASGNVALALGIPAAFCSVAGNYAGSGLALTKGVKAIKPAFVVVLLLLLVKVGIDLLG